MSDQPVASDDITAQLQLFDKDPKTAMAHVPRKQVIQGPTNLPLAKFPASSIQSGAYVQQRDQYRQKMCGERAGVQIRLDQIAPGRAPFAKNDLAEDLVDVPAAQILRKLEDMEARKLLSAKLKVSPWSSTYWPIYEGQTGSRYADPKFPNAEDWKKNRDYVTQSPASGVVSAGGAAVDGLSPAEKYDLLCGDPDFTLTEANWRDGQQYYDAKGSVETWMGICHGWSPASYMLARPVKPVRLTAADGTTQITFYPADIKALGSLLWAKTNPTVRFIGGRCNDKNPQTDESGRLVSQDCFDTNPGTWHLSVVNQLGVAGRSLIIDASFDYEVWNQPLLGYSYSYFNPQTRKRVATLHDARVDRSAFTSDKFAKYRSPSARSMVGVAMQLTYIAETLPSHATADSAQQDRLVVVNYLYDLEHDQNGMILGGEWYLNKHPDFLWTPPAQGQALSNQDASLSGSWTGGALPDGWADAAAAASANGQPLAKIVNTLFALAK